MTMREGLRRFSLACLWLFSAVALLSIAAQNVLFFGMAAWLLLCLLDKPKDLVPQGALAWSLPFLAWALAACLMADNQAHSLETFKRWLLLSAAWYAGGALRSPRASRAILGALLFFSALICLGAALWALQGPVQAFKGGENLASLLARWNDAGDWRAHSGSGGYMVLGTGSMLLLCYFSALALKERSFRSPLALACLAALALGLLMTQTRGAWVGAGAGLALVLASRPRIFLWSLALLLLVFDFFPGNPILGRLEQGLEYQRATVRERMFMAEAAHDLERLHPWFGIGDSLESWTENTDGQARQYEGYYRRLQAPRAGIWGFDPDAEEGHLHSDFRQLAVMYGIPALALLLLFYLRLGASALAALFSPLPLAQGAGLGLLAALVAWWVNGLWEYNFGSFQSGFIQWFLVGLSLALFRLKAEAA
jgi:O-antigen ligase